ncbi:hypothetical protein [Calothrix sp. PCC 7507]|uniref:hypothetical protein n=1 Tax=Calothrix sp. PCC 7507 TaxID=99598 RepID=UPI00029F1BDD|nr:hypothetical protein [Calothrix sp. PCC 7507]AFY32580.1 hypothetical protein Cal7507_2138 [Calothrix sp. PCC 7507]
MTKPIQILLQTTIPTDEDDWYIGRFSLLRDYLASLKSETGEPLYQVTARDRQSAAGENDPVLSSLEDSDFDQLWLFAVDIGDGITPKECESISAFRQRGGGLLVTRDHQDLGSCVCNLGGVGSAHYFHSQNPEPDPSRHCPDNIDNKSISWPNYDSGLNGDYQKIIPQEPLHDLLKNLSFSGEIEFFPAHPHEGAVGVPANEKNARVIAVGTSLVSGRNFNLVVAFDSVEDEEGNILGRAIAQSSFHHFADYNWDTDLGSPSFVSEPPGEGMKQNQQALEDIQAYVRNAALWLTSNTVRLR